MKYQLLNIIEFSSARKRMTMVMRKPSGGLIVMGKGADSTLIPLLKKDDHNDAINNAVNDNKHSRSKVLKQTEDYL